MKVTIYNRDGSTFKSLECEAVHPHCGDYKSIVIHTKEDNTVATIEGLSAIDDYIYTNLPFAVDGKLYQYQQDEPCGPKERVTLLSDNGSEIRMWKNAMGLSYLRDIVSFKADGEWYAVSGNVTINPM